MAGQDRDLTLRRWVEQLERSPAQADFFAAVELLERLHGGPPVGAAERHQDESLIFRHTTSLGFQAGDIVEVEPRAGGHEMMVAFFGLTGEVTPLPLAYAEEADEDEDEADVLRGFLDLFHHRMLALLVRGVWEADFGRAFGGGDWARRVLAYLGDDDGARPDALDPGVMLRLAPILAAGTCSARLLAEAVKISLGEEFGDVEVRCEPLTGGWTEIDRDQWTLLGSGTARLGDSAVLGSNVRHPAGAARVSIGPVAGGLEAFREGGEAHRRVLTVLRLVVSARARVDVVVETNAASRPEGRLGERRLGVDCWLQQDYTAPHRRL